MSSDIAIHQYIMSAEWKGEQVNDRGERRRALRISVATLVVMLYIQSCMQTTYPIRLDSNDKRLFKQAARAAGLSLAEFIRRAAREKAAPAEKRAACLDYPEIQVDPEAEANPKEFIRKQLARNHARHC
jgi:hypothetical protein